MSFSLPPDDVDARPAQGPKGHALWFDLVHEGFRLWLFSKTGVLYANLEARTREDVIRLLDERELQLTEELKEEKLLSFQQVSAQDKALKIARLMVYGNCSAVQGAQRIADLLPILRKGHDE